MQAEVYAALCVAEELSKATTISSFSIAPSQQAQIYP